MLSESDKVTFVDEKHSIDAAIKFSATLLEYAKLAFFERACVPMGLQGMLSSRRVLIIKNTLMKVSGCMALASRGGKRLALRH